MPVEFDLNLSFSSTEYAKMCFINYKYKNNTMGISAEDFGKMVGHYDQATIASWVKYSDDYNEYEFTDDEHNKANEAGKERGRDLTGYDNNGADKFDQTGRSVGDGLMATASGARAVAGAGKMASFASYGATKVGRTGSKIGSAAKEIYEGEQISANVGKIGSKSADGATKAANWLLLASCALDLAMGIFAVAKPANKEQAEACEDLTKEMPDLQEDSYEASGNIMTWNDELQEMGDEAGELNEEANGSMSDNRGDMDFHLRTIAYFESAQTAGYRLTQEDYDAYIASMNYMAQLDNENNETFTVTDEEKKEILEDMKGYQGNFDDAAQTIDEVQGVTDYSEGFDEKTEDLCRVEKYMQWLNVGGAVIDAAQATMRAIGPQVFIYAPAAAAAAAGAIMSGIAAVQQGKFQQTAAEEVELREQTQEVNNVSQDTYNENVDYFEGYVEDVGNLALVKPDDYEVPTGGMSGMVPPEDPDEGNDGDGDGRDGNTGGKKPKRP